ncbi:hypothetical protein BGX28_010001, partial [Mortierella sp. GBA30]
MVATNTAHSSPYSVPVLIVGAGPVGLLEAYLLAKLGIQVRIIEREKAISPLSKATLLHARSLEVFQFTGVLDEFMKVGIPLEESKVFVDNKLKVTVPALSGADTHHSIGLALEQSITSEILIQKLVKLGVSVDFGWELLDTKVIEQEVGKEEPYVETIIRRVLSEDDGTGSDARDVLERVDLLEPKEGNEYEIETVRSQYLVASDGGRSTVRHKLNIGFPGRTLPQDNFIWDGTYECDIDLGGMTSVAGVDKMMNAFPLTSGDTRLFFMNLEPEDENKDFANVVKDLTAEKFQEMVSSTVAPARFKIKTTSWLTAYKVNERRAETFVHKNRIFLAGDAAHVHSPAGGLGLNTGVLDAHNLAWKLALVLNKVAPQSLLETYAERAPMGDLSIELSHKFLEWDGTIGVRQAFKRLYYTLAPYLLAFMKALKIQKPNTEIVESNQLGVRYEENALNKAHVTQPRPRSEHQVGTRARDGPLCTAGCTSGETKDVELRVHDLLLGVGRFHVLVFAADMLTASRKAYSKDIKGVKTTDAKKLAHNIDRFRTQWRSKWSYSSNLNDGHNDKDLFKIHIIADSFTPTIDD